MARTNKDGKDVRLVCSWLTKRQLTDADMAEALGVSPSTYSRRKDDAEYPLFEDLENIANHFGLSARALQVAFGHVDLNEVILDDDAMNQYVEQGGGVRPDFPTRGAVVTKIRTRRPVRRKMTVNPSAPPL